MIIIIIIIIAIVMIMIMYDAGEIRYYKRKDPCFDVFRKDKIIMALLRLEKNT